MRVLVVDDDPAALEIRRLVIARRGHEVREACDVKQARAAFAAGVDVILLDLRLPHVEDGLTLIREFRGTRVVVLCGDRGDLDGREEAGMVAMVLEKPVRSELLVRAIER